MRVHHDGCARRVPGGRVRRGHRRLRMPRLRAARRGTAGERVGGSRLTSTADTRKMASRRGTRRPTLGRCSEDQVVGRGHQGSDVRGPRHLSRNAGLGARVALGGSRRLMRQPTLGGDRMQLTNEQEAAIAYRVRESLDQPHRWKQGDWGTDDDGEEILFDGGMTATLYDKPHDDRCLLPGWRDPRRLPGGARAGLRVPQRRHRGDGAALCRHRRHDAERRRGGGA